MREGHIHYWGSVRRTWHVQRRGKCTFIRVINCGLLPQELPGDLVGIKVFQNLDSLFLKGFGDIGMIVT